MKTIIVLLLLTIGLCEVHKVSFTLDVEHFHYHIYGHAYPDVGRLGWLSGGSGLSAPFNGTFTNKEKHHFPVSGKIEIGEPLLFHLGKIHVSGKVDDPDKLTFEGKFSVHFFDIAKKKIPMKGKLEFNNKKSAKAVVHINRSSY